MSKAQIANTIIMGLSVLLTILFSLEYPDGTLFFSINLFVQLILFIGAHSAIKSDSISFWGFSYYLYFVFNLIRGGVIVAYDQFGVQHRFIGSLPLDQVTWGAILFALGIFATFVGYSLNRKSRSKISVKASRAVRKITRSVDDSRIVTTAFYASALIACALAVTMSQSFDAISAKRVFVTSSGVETRFGPVRFLLGVFYLYILLIAYKRYYERKNIANVLVPMAITAIIGFAISLRIFILLPFLPILMDAARSLSFKKVTLAMLVFSVFVINIAYVSGARKFGSEYRLGTATEVVQDFLVATTINTNFGGYLPTAISTIALGNTAPLLYGKSIFLAPFTQFIPRAIFPDKPEELGGEVRKSLQEVGFFPHWMQGGVPPGIFAEGWLNFRWAGVIAVGWFIGWLVKFLENLRRGAPSAVEYAFSTVLILVIVFFVLGGVWSRIVMMMCQLFLALWISMILGRFFIRNG